MKLGFIGTGNIVSDVVTGISKSKIYLNCDDHPSDILISAFCKIHVASKLTIFPKIRSMKRVQH